jgi:hypothetical protein
MKSQKPFKNIKILQKKSFFISKIPLMLEGMILKILKISRKRGGFYNTCFNTRGFVPNFKLSDSMSNFIIS